MQPLEIREALPAKARKVQKLGLLLPSARQSDVSLLAALESGRYAFGSVFYYVVFMSVVLLTIW